MKTGINMTIALALLLLSISALRAEYVPEVLKRAEMAAKVAQYKVETGFKGEVQYDLERMVITRLDGVLPTIHLISYADTTAKRIQSEIIINGLLKYFGVPREQLRYKDEGDQVKYFQEINGIGFDAKEARLVIYYCIADTTTFCVLNKLYAIPDMSPQVTIDEKEAIEIARPLELSNNPLRPAINVYDNVFKPSVVLKYVNYGSISKPEIRLCWIYGYFGYRVEIDAITGEVIKHFLCGAHSASDEVNAGEGISNPAHR